MPATRPCAFCRIVADDAPAAIVDRTDHTVTFLDARPLLPGHCLLVPRRHVATLGELPDELVAPVFARVKLLARAVERALEADGAFTAINIKVSQSVPHLHVHVVPRWRDDKLFSPKLVWKRRPYGDEAEREAVRAAIAGAAGELAAAAPAGG